MQELVLERPIQLFDDDNDGIDLSWSTTFLSSLSRGK